MPELPEVQTTVDGLNKKVLGGAFLDVWSDIKKFEFLKKEIRGKEILRVWRRAKNVVFDLSGGQSLLAHQKMTGHFLIGCWVLDNGRWKPVDEKGPLNDPYNKYIHLMFWLSNGLMMGLSDARKFAKVELWKTDDLKKEFEKLGPEPLDKNFTLEKFKNILGEKKGAIKQVLMDPFIIAGIGNIYSSEALWRAKIHPQKSAVKLNERELKNLFGVTKKVLKLGVKLGGESFSDYRKPDGTKGNFDSERRVYKREGQKCHRCGAQIKRLKVGQRSAFYCPHCQTL